VQFPPNVKFVSQDEDGEINMYHSDPVQRSADKYWTCKNFICYLQTEYGEDLYLPQAEDFRTALFVVEEGKVVGLAEGCAYYEPNQEPTEFTIKLHQEDFEYLMDTSECAELVVGIVNTILKEHGSNIRFDVDFSYEGDDNVED